MRVIALIVRAGAVVVAAGFLFSLLVDGAETPAVVAQPDRVPPSTTPRPAPIPPEPQVPGVVTIAATGDVGMGSAPNLPAGGGSSLFADVEADLAGDVVVGPLAGVLASGGTSRCEAGRACDAVRAPPSYARPLAQAGFTTMSLATDHAYDFGAPGLRRTVEALTENRVLHTGLPRQVAIQQIGDIRVALVGFAPFSWSAPSGDLPGARRLVRRAARSADVVIVAMHRGASSDDDVRLAHAVVDAGADLVVGSGPDLAGMEWYKRRLIAYSLGTFVDYGAPAGETALARSAILRVILRADGAFETGRLVPTRLVGRGAPARDGSEAAHGIVRAESRDAFGARGVKVSREGLLSR